MSTAVLDDIEPGSDTLLGDSGRLVRDSEANLARVARDANQLSQMVETIAEAAARLQLAESTIRSWVHRRQLKPITDVAVTPVLLCRDCVDRCYRARELNSRYAARRRAEAARAVG